MSSFPPVRSLERAPEYTLALFADPSHVKEAVKATLHTIFFHRYFIPITPLSRDLLDLTFPYVQDNDLETLIDQRATSLARAVEMPLSSTSSPPLSRLERNGQAGRAQITLQFFETKKKKKTYFFTKPDEDVCWETWVLDVTCANPSNDSEAAKVRRAMEKSLHNTAFKILGYVNRDKDHIPPIHTTDTNPFPYTINIALK